MSGVQQAALTDMLVGVTKIQDLFVRSGVDDTLLAKFVGGVVEIAGTLLIEEASVVTPAFPKLEKVGTLQVTDNGNLRTLALPKVSRVDKAMVIQNNKLLGTIDIPAITEIGGEMTLRLMASLVVLGMPKLAILGGDYYVDALPLLRSMCGVGLEIKGVAPTATITITNCPKITRGDPQIFGKARLFTIARCKGVNIKVRSFDDFQAVQNIYNTSLGVTVDVGDVTLDWAGLKTQHVGTMFQRVSVVYGDLIISGEPCCCAQVRGIRTRQVSQDNT